ncbi:MAG: hypothetical protein Q8M51_03305 [Polaromonas sp.]|nr:hypothetical protein [Polaromonas sp.]
MLGEGGGAGQTSIYTEANPRWMPFRDMLPNPTARLIRAACQTGKVASNQESGRVWPALPSFGGQSFQTKPAKQLRPQAPLS